MPIGVPPSEESIEIGRAVAEIAAESGMNIKAIGSTDLTHYGMNYGFLPQGSGPEAIDWVRNDNDKRAIDAMLELDPKKVLMEARENQNACCAGAVSAVMVISPLWTRTSSPAIMSVPALTVRAPRVSTSPPKATLPVLASTSRVPLP